MKILICDDETEYIEDIKNHVDLFMCEHNIPADFCTFDNVETLLQTPQYYDIAFLDVEMGNNNGIDVGKQLKQINENIVIFIITAYDKYLDAAMDLNVLRFLSKPLNTERLYSGLKKAIDIIDTNILSILLDDNKNYINLAVQDILYVEIVNRKIKVVTKEKTFFSKTQISFWQEKLVASFFYQIHKSFIVNIKHIKNYTKQILEMENGDKIPVSYRKQAAFHKYFVNYYTRG